MKRKAALGVEFMEARALLSTVPTGLSGTLRTDQATYELGQPIQFLLTETNVTNQPIDVVLFGPGAYPFNVAENGTTIWSSYDVSELQPQDISTEMLEPGQSYTEKAQWNGIIGNGSDGSAQLNSSPVATSQTAVGSFTVTNSADPSIAPVTFQIESSLSYKMTVSVPAPAANTVTLSYSTTNVSSSPVTVTLAPTDFVITDPAADVVEDTNPGASEQRSETETIEPGQSITQMATWDDSAYEGSLGAEPSLEKDLTVSTPTAPSGLEVAFSLNMPPNLIISPPASGSSGGNGGDPPVATTPIRTMITTGPEGSDSSSSTPVYTIGRPIAISLALTNTTENTVDLSTPSRGTQVTILDGDTVVYRKKKLLHPPRIKALKAGRSLDVSLMWNGKPNEAGVQRLAPGAYTIEVTDDGYSAQTTIDLVSRGSRA